MQRRQFRMFYGILAASLDAQPLGAVFHENPQKFLEPIVGVARPVPIECEFLFSEAMQTILPPGVEACDLLFTIAAVLRHGWDERRMNVQDAPPIHELEGHEVVTRCLRALHAMVEAQSARPQRTEPSVYCGVQDKTIRITPKKLLDALCRMRREGRVAWDVLHASVPHTHLHASVA